MACPTCGGPADELWPAGHHPFTFGPEASACGRCGASRQAAVHQASYRSRYPTVDELAEALHVAGGSACRGDHTGGGRSGLAAIRRHHRPQAQAVVRALDQQRRPPVG